MNSNRIDWGSGEITYWDMAYLDESLPLDSQISHLKEDLAQISFPNNIIIDIGWYPEFDPRGRFVIFVVQNGEWEAPLFRADAADITALCQQILQAVAVAT